MPSARADARELMALLGGELAGYAQVEELRIADDGVERRAQLVRHHREKLRLGLARRFRLGACGAFTLELPLALDRFPPIGHVTKRHEPRRLTGMNPSFRPIGVDDAQLRRHRLAAGPNDFDVRALPGENGKAELRADELVDAPTEQQLRRRIRKANHAVRVDDEDAVGEALDDGAQASLLLRPSPPAIAAGAPLAHQSSRSPLSAPLPTETR